MSEINISIVEEPELNGFKIGKCNKQDVGWSGFIPPCPFSEKFINDTGLHDIFEYSDKFDIKKYEEGTLYYGILADKVVCLLFYTPIKKELFRAFEDRVVINVKSVNKDMFEEDLFNGSYGLLLGPLACNFQYDDTCSAKIIKQCVSDNEEHRRYVAIVEDANHGPYTSNRFKFIGDIKNKYLMMR